MNELKRGDAAFCVRERLPSDLAACVGILRAVHDLDGYPLVWPEDPSRWLAPQRQERAWVAESGNGGVIGHVALHNVTGHPMTAVCSAATGLTADHLVAVSRLIVSPAWRGRGVGTRLTRIATTRASADGRRPVLDVAQANSKAIALYESLGWQRVGELETGYRRRIPVFVFVAPRTA